MAKLKRNSLTKEIIFLVLSGFAAAFILFLILFQVGTTLLSEYFAGSNFIYNSETSYINELTEFVHKKSLLQQIPTNLAIGLIKREFGILLFPANGY